MKPFNHVTARWRGAGGAVVTAVAVALTVSLGAAGTIALLARGDATAETKTKLFAPAAARTGVAPAAANGAHAPGSGAGHAAMTEGGAGGPGGTALTRGLLVSGGAFFLTFPLLAWVLARPRTVNTISAPGFEIITPSEARRFIPVEEKFQHMDFLTNVKTRGSLRLSANLDKVNLSFRRYGYLLEDKNFRNALLVNRRRVRRTLLRDGDVLDMGDLTLLYRDSRQVPIIRHSAVTPPEGKVMIKFDRARGPVRRGMPMLVAEAQPNRPYYITKNLVYIGRSEINDLIVKSQNVGYRHAKIERVGSRYKLLDLSGSGNTFVNNRRVEQRMLKEGDEISIDNQRMKFQIVAKDVHMPHQSSAQESQEDDNGTDDGARAADD